MRPQRPYVVEPDEIIVTRDGETAVIEYKEEIFGECARQVPKLRWALNSIIHFSIWAFNFLFGELCGLLL